MLRCFLLVCLFISNVSLAHVVSGSLYARDLVDRNDSDETSDESLEAFITDVKKDAKNVTNRHEWNYFMETLKTEENMLRKGKSVVQSLVPEIRRSILNWFKDLLPKKTKTTTSTPTAVENPKVNIEPRVSDNLEPILTRLIDALEKFNENIEKIYARNKTYYLIEAPVSDSEKVGVSELANKPVLRIDDVEPKVTIEEYVTEETEIKTECPLGVLHSNDKDDDATIPVINIKGKRREKRDVNATEDTNVDEKANGENATNYIEYHNRSDVNITDDVNINDTVNSINARRSNNINPGVIRSKLVKYVHEMFNELKEKLMPMATLKKRFNNDISFKIGYLTANLNNIESNLARLRSQVENKGNSWNEYEILEAFDVLKMYRNMVVRLIDSVQFYLKRMKLT